MSERGRRAGFGGIGGRGEEEAGRIGLLMGVCLLIVVSFRGIGLDGRTETEREGAAEPAIAEEGEERP